MRQISYIKLVLALLLFVMPVSLAGCKSDPSVKSEELRSDLGSGYAVKKAYDEFQASLDEFLSELNEAVGNTSMRNNLNSMNVDEKVHQLMEEINRSDQELDVQTTVAIIKNIRKITDRLKNGLESQAVKQVQDFLPTVGGDGEFGPDTQDAIDSFLKEHSNKLRDEIDKIEEKNIVPWLEKKVVHQQETIQRIEEENNQLRDILWIWKNVSILAFVFAIVSMVGSLYKIFGKNKAPIQVSAKSSQASDEEQVFRKNFERMQDNLYQIFCDRNELRRELNRLRSELSTDIENRLRERETQQRNYGTNTQNASTNRLNRLVQKVTPPASEGKQITSSKPPVNSNKIYSAPTPQWITAYNHNPISLSRQATEVSETEESINNRRLGRNESAVLERNRRGNYWIIGEGGYDYLVPKGNMTVNEYNYKTVQALFECRGYQPGYSHNFQILKPARVSSISSGQTWQLEESGILQFS